MIILLVVVVMVLFSCAYLIVCLFSTTENLAVFVWLNFDHHFRNHPARHTTNARLYKVKIHETESNVVEFMGEGLPLENGNGNANLS